MIVQEILSQSANKGRKGIKRPDAKWSAQPHQAYRREAEPAVGERRTSAASTASNTRVNAAAARLPAAPDNPELPLDCRATPHAAT